MTPPVPPVNDLAGITVVALEQAVAAPYATAKLADAGARVIKIERPTGDFARHYDQHVKGQSAYFVWLNRGKQSVVLDLAGPRDRAALGRMIASADVFIQNLKPGALDRFGLGSAALREQRPRLITCDISGFGRSGPLAHLKAYDLVVQAEAGLCAITGDRSGPARVGVSVCDIAAGVTAHSAIVQALFARERSGEGRAIEVSLFDSLAEWMNVPLLQYLYGGLSPQRCGVAHPTIAPYGAFACRGGEQVIMSIQNQPEWASFCKEFLGSAALATDDRFWNNSARVANRSALDKLVSRAFASRTLATALRDLSAAGIAHGRLRSLEEFAAHPQLRLIEIDTPKGVVKVIAPAAIVAGAPLRAGVPALGADTDKVLSEFAEVPA